MSHERGRIELGGLSASELRTLQGNLERTGRRGQAEAIAAELRRRRGDPRDAEAPGRRSGWRRPALATLAAAAAAGVVASLVLAPTPRRLTPDLRPPPVATPTPRAMVARTPEIGVGGNAVTADAAATETDASQTQARPGRTARTPPAPFPSPAGSPVAPRSYAAAETPPPGVEPPLDLAPLAPAAEDAGVLAVSRSAALAAPGCADESAGGTVLCRGTRRAAAAPGRGAPIPLRVAVSPSRAASLARASRP